MSRKILSFLVVFAMLVSSISFAFAADTSKLTSGITDTNVSAAVAKIGALGMTQGLDDGTFGADQALNRAQAATFIVRALGLEAAALAAKGQATTFADVAADNWAAGYISVAQGQGLVEGVGDGKFAPDAPFTYAQAVTILCRALGYKSEFLPGAWPGNYLAKAADKKITKNVTVSPSGVANRGAFAVMLANTCDATVVRVDKYTSTGIEYSDVGTPTLVADKLEMTKLEDTRFTKNDRLGNAVDTIHLKGDLNKDGDFLDLNEDNDFDLASADIDDETLIGQRVNVYLNTDKKVVLMEKSDKVTATIYYEIVDKFMDNGDVKLKFSGKIYDEAAGCTEYVNGAVAALAAGQYGKFIVENGKIVFADVYNAFEKSSLMVKSIDGDKITHYAANATSTTVLNIASSYAGGSIVKINGATAKLADLKPYDVLNIKTVAINGKDTAVVFAFRNTATGKVNGMKGSGTDRPAIDVGGTNFDVGDNATFSTTGDETVVDLAATAAAASNDIDSMYGADATVYKDMDNKIRHIAMTINVTSGEKYGVIKKVSTDTETVKIRTQDGTDVTYSLEDTAKIGYQTSTSGTHFTTVAALKAAVDADSDLAYDAGDYVFASYKLTKDGKIAKDTLLVKSTVQAAAIGGNFGTDTMKTASTLYVDTANVAVFDAATFVAGTSTNPSIAAWSALSKKDDPKAGVGALFAAPASGEMGVVVFTKDEVKGTAGGDVKGIFVVEGTAADSCEGAYVIAYFTRDGDSYAKIQRYGQSAAEELKIGTDGAGLKESARIVRKTSADKVDIYLDAAAYTAATTKTAFSTVAGKVYAIDGTKFSIGGTATTDVYKAEDNALVYSGDAVKSLGDIQVNDVVVALVKDGKIQAIEWNASESGSGVTAVDGTITRAGTTYTFGGGLNGLAWSSLDCNLFYDTTTNRYLSAMPDNTTRTVKAWKKIDENKIKSVILY